MRPSSPYGLRQKINRFALVQTGYIRESYKKLTQPEIKVSFPVLKGNRKALAMKRF